MACLALSGLKAVFGCGSSMLDYVHRVLYLLTFIDTVGVE
jgi:hypothetical protein